MKFVQSVSLVALLLSTGASLRAQQVHSISDVYRPEANAIYEIDSVVAMAQVSEKHVFIMIGGNWCKWCRLFDKWSSETAQVDSLIKADYVTLHVNYSKENKNPAALQRFGYPQRFGFPVFIILDGQGNRLHTQNTAYLEEGEGYSEKKSPNS
jgi:thiol:disulfide interchange protein